jgi:pimeloyl-ACP methyl ester carboxylesterase
MIGRRPNRPVGLSPSSRGDVYRANVPGAQLRYLRTGNGRSVVLLHTLRTQLEYFTSVLERLDKTRVEVTAVDLPGHGHSSAPPVDYSAEYFADSVERLLELCDLREALVAGDSIGATIALTLAARGNPRISHVIAVNPYDYGAHGGIRRSSRLANVLFAAMLWPWIGAIVPRSENRWVLRKIMEGGLRDPRALPATLVEEMHRCGSLPGHARAFRSLNRQWRTWIAARTQYPAIELPITLVYGSDDWSRPSEREANAKALPGARVVSLEHCGHFASLERPDAVARLIDEAL